CGNLSQAVLINHYWIAAWTDNYIDYQSSFITEVTQGEQITFLGNVGFVFQTSQPETIPLYGSLSSSAQDHRLQLGDAAGNPPQQEPGWTVPSIFAYVYPTQICGSVPLFALFSAGSSDWFYTADPVTRDAMVANGYVLMGNEGFVLPTNQCKNLAE
ncbi:hypothetical protein M422DRAFT_196313, partial [Sphaerobolus stellatus SS14]